MGKKTRTLALLTMFISSMIFLGCDVPDLPGSDSPPVTDSASYVTTTFEAENAEIVPGAAESEHAGYSGTGYANTDNEYGAYIAFSVTVSTAASYDLMFTYALSSGNRYASIQVNGITVVSNINFEATGAWTSWSTSSASVNLPEGTNIITLTAEQASGLPNIDKMDVSGYEPDDGDSSDTDIESGDIVLSPGDDLQAAIDTIAAGNTIWLESGTYAFSQTILIAEGNNGSSGAYKGIRAAEGAQPVIDFSAMEENSSLRGIVLAGDYWHIYGITVTEAGDNGMLLAGNNNVVERCRFIANHDTGLQISRYDSSYDEISEWPANNLVLQCESYDNCDSDGEDADGFAAKLTSGEGNVFRGCYSHNNIDDGWDFYTKTATGEIGKVTLEYCIALNNGTLTDGTTKGNGDRNGFKLGGSDISVDHTVRYCIAANNGKHGFTYNRNLGNITMVHNTAYNNAERNFNFDGGESTFLNNISLESGSNDRIIGSSLNDAYNAWWDDGEAISGNGVTVTSADFQSLSTGTLTWVSNHSVNLGNLLIPAVGSDLIGSASDGENMGAR
jgi:hypothetical protein